MSLDAEKLIPKDVPPDHKYHLMGVAGFGVLLGTFALHKCPRLELPLGASTLMLTLALTGLCFTLAITEFKQYDTKKPESKVHLAKAVAFSFAGCGTFSIFVNMILMKAIGMSFMRYAGPIPAACLCMAKCIFSVAHYQQKGEKWHARVSALQALALAFIFVGALQEYGSIKMISGVRTLNIMITVCAALASLSAFALVISDGHHTHSDEKRVLLTK
jgi:hypothetical protein